MLRDSLVTVSMPWKIPARRAEYSLTESALSPFQAEPTQVGCRQTLPWDYFPLARHLARKRIGWEMRMSSQTVDHGEGHVLDRGWLISWALRPLIDGPLRTPSLERYC